MAITLRQIQAFLAVAEHGTFTKAGERMHMAQPALSQLVRELEQELGLRLFDRTTRRVELTEGGREFRGAAAKIVEDLEIAVSSASDLAERKRGRIVVAAPPLLAAVILPEAIAEMRERYPGIQISVVDAKTDTIVEAVRVGRADCGLGTFAAEEDGIERVPMARDSLMLFCDHSSRFAATSTWAWGDLRDEPLITLTRDSGIRLLVEVGYETAGVPLTPAYEVSQITTALALVEARLGIAVLPTYARAAAPHRRVIAKQLAEPTIARDIVMIKRSDRSTSPALAAFEGVLRRYARRLAPHDID
ncbi:MAG: LysR family transcriptional regulator [Kaiparowitsia implicata GSE-PSE-MK54-09C]|nr:LysR family transcriptional regulator [Kaiparowitsia implicata GSE-PSE-MK54-09C]